MDYISFSSKMGQVVNNTTAVVCLSMDFFGNVPCDDGLTIALTPSSNDETYHTGCPTNSTAGEKACTKSKQARDLI